MGKIDGLKILDQEIKDAVLRVARNSARPNKHDIFFLTDKYNECNTSSYTYRDVSVCPDCRRHVLKFWKNIINEQR